MLTFAELLKDLEAKCWQIVGLAAGYQSIFGVYLLVHPFATSITDVSLEAWPGGYCASGNNARFNE
jgi:hypothetical protein